MDIIDKIITGLFVFVLGTMWFFSTKYYSMPKAFSIIIYDDFGNEINIEGIRTSFQTSEVAKSFLNEYQKSFPDFQFDIANHNLNNYQRRSVKFFGNLLSQR